MISIIYLFPDSNVNGKIVGYDKSTEKTVRNPKEKDEVN
jgi:hypothetical protein